MFFWVCARAMQESLSPLFALVVAVAVAVVVIVVGFGVIVVAQVSRFTCFLSLLARSGEANVGKERERERECNMVAAIRVSPKHKRD